MRPYKIEVGENEKPSTCTCCGRISCIGHGFVYGSGNARAVYYAGWSTGHLERRVTFAIAIGEWGDESTVSDRSCFGLEARAEDGQILFVFTGPQESPWGTTELLGKMVSRQRALRDHLADEALEIAERIVRAHPAISVYLGSD